MTPQHKTAIPFVVDTFIQTRGESPYRVFHPTGDPDHWKALRDQYDHRRRHGHCATETPGAYSVKVPLHFDAGPDRFLILADPEQLEHNHVLFSQAWIGITPADAPTVWLLLDTDHLRVRSRDRHP